MTLISRMGKVARQVGLAGGVDEADPLLDCVSSGHADAKVTIFKGCYDGRKGPAQAYLAEDFHNVRPKDLVLRYGQSIGEKRHVNGLCSEVWRRVECPFCRPHQVGVCVGEAVDNGVEGGSCIGGQWTGDKKVDDEWTVASVGIVYIGQVERDSLVGVVAGEGPLHAQGNVIGLGGLFLHKLQQGRQRWCAEVAEHRLAVVRGLAIGALQKPRQTQSEGLSYARYRRLCEKSHGALSQTWGVRDPLYQKGYRVRSDVGQGVSRVARGQPAGTVALSVDRNPVRKGAARVLRFSGSGGIYNKEDRGRQTGRSDENPLADPHRPSVAGFLWSFNFRFLCHQ